jgi:DNA polymerase-1
LNIKEDEADRYIHNFFAGYPKVNFFIQRIQKATFDIGYVTMITGRRRRFQEIKDKRWYGAIQRQCINTKIQGSAADLIKIAMIQLDRELVTLDSHQLIQIHDEIIVEAPIDKVEQVKKVMKEVMEGALKLRVPIRISIVEGDRWVKN